MNSLWLKYSEKNTVGGGGEGNNKGKAFTEQV